VKAVENREGQKSRSLGALGPRGGSPDRRLSTSTNDLLERLRITGQPMSLAALADASSRHPNTVREHLDTLIRAGLVTRTREDPHGRGRPAWTYQATSATTEASEYAALAVVLSSTIARTSAQPSTDAEVAGEDWGRALARARGATPTTPESARDRAVELLDDLGFEPRQDPADLSAVRLTRCPLLDAARENPKIVCNVHLGMLRGALAEYGADPTGSDLVAFAEPGACLFVIPPVDQAR
jgi:predicted ArsR family transcriptional regulator